MNVNRSPQKPNFEFRGAQADFQSSAYRERINQVLKDVRSLEEKAVIDRDRLKARAGV